MTEVPGHHPSVVLTGATGFVGHYLLAELLGRGCRCTAVLRGPADASRLRLAELLGELGVDAAPLISNGSLTVAEGDLHGGLPPLTVDDSTALVHAAAATNFHRNAAGDPDRTNVAGTRRLVAWAEQLGIRRIHLVSSAYTCGEVTGTVDEAFHPDPPVFHNDYERTKWEAEGIGVDWARAPGRHLTIYRPAVVVGAFESGRATRFGGFYVSARAAELLDRMHRDRPAPERQAIPLRICGRPLDRQNMVPVDYVAAMMAAVVCRPQYAGRIYNLVHPDPPTNLQIKQAFEGYFGIGGGRFVPPETLARAELNECEQSFCEASRSIRHYFVDTPEFIRDNTAALEREAGIVCPSYDAAALARLLRYARSVGWGRRGRSLPWEGPACAKYFETFLPARVLKSQIARLTALTATVRFVIEDEPNGQWVCRFERGKLAGVERGPNGRREDFGYRTSREVFWQSISGRYHPQEFFLTGRAEMFGDVEQALKMAMILYAFTQEFPCDRETLARLGEGSCSQS